MTPDPRPVPADRAEQWREHGDSKEPAPAPRDAVPTRSRTADDDPTLLTRLAGLAWVVAGVLSVSALGWPTSRYVIQNFDGSGHRYEQDYWLTGKIQVSTQGGGGQSYYTSWIDWPVAVVCVVAIVGAGLWMYARGARRLTTVAAVLAFATAWMMRDVLETLTHQQPGGSASRATYQLAPAGWALLGALVLLVLATALVIRERRTRPDRA